MFEPPANVTVRISPLRSHCWWKTLRGVLPDAGNAQLIVSPFILNKLCDIVSQYALELHPKK
jgi:hypothetical protein